MNLVIKSQRLGRLSLPFESRRREHSFAARTHALSSITPYNPCPRSTRRKVEYFGVWNFGQLGKGKGFFQGLLGRSRFLFANHQSDAVRHNPRPAASVEKFFANLKRVKTQSLPQGREFRLKFPQSFKRLSFCGKCNAARIEPASLVANSKSYTKFLSENPA